MNSGSQHLHTLHVGVLALHIGGSHEHFALHIHQCTHCGSSHSVLSGTGFGDDARLSHLLGHQYLADGSVDFVSAGVVQVFTFQI